MKRALTTLALLVAAGPTLLGATAAAQPTDEDWKADTIKVTAPDPADDVRVDSGNGDVPDSFYEQTDVHSTRIVIKRAAATPKMKLTFRADKVIGPNQDVDGHQAYQYFGVSIYRNEAQIHIVGIEAQNRNGRVTVSKDLEARRCRAGTRAIDQAADTFTITLPLTCLRWTGWTWGLLEPFSVLGVNGDSGRGVDFTYPWTRALPLTAQ